MIGRERGALGRSFSSSFVKRTCARCHSPAKHRVEPVFRQDAAVLSAVGFVLVQDPINRSRKQLYY